MTDALGEVQLLPDVLPDALRGLRGWLCWRYEQVDGESKPRKVPYYVNAGRRHGVQGSPEDRAMLATFEAAKAHAVGRGFDGVGLALLPEFGITALDFDDCMVDGGVHPEVERLIAGTYAEYSPSRTGVRAFMRGQLGNEKSKGPPWGFEVFSSKGFVTVTGQRLEVTEILGTENTIGELTEDVRALYTQRFGGQRVAADADPLMDHEPTLGLTEPQIVEALDALDPDLPHDQWLHVGMALHHETEGRGFALWDGWSRKGTKYPNERTLRQRWESFGKEAGRPVTARTLLKMAADASAQVATPSEIAAAAEQVSDKPPRFPFYRAGDFSRRPPPNWIIKGVIPDAEIVAIYGESGSGKSFVALDMVAAVARGVPWRGHRTIKGGVFYIAAEGGGGFRNRLTAYAQHHGVALDDLPLQVMPVAPNFMDKTDAAEVARIVKMAGPCRVVVVDTLAQVTPGANENAGQDMGKALAHCKGIHRATGALVILIHHSGKDAARGARGWSGIKAALDAELEVVRTLTGRAVRVTKQKDADDTGEWGFDLQVVPIGQDEDGDIIDSCVVVEAAVPMMGKSASTRPLGPWEKLVVEVVGELTQATGEAEKAAVLDEVVKRGEAIDQGNDPKHRRDKARNALRRVCDGGQVPYLLDGDKVRVL